MFIGRGRSDNERDVDALQLVRGAILESYNAEVFKTDSECDSVEWQELCTQ